MGSQSSKEVTVTTDKELLTPQYIKNCQNEVNNWHASTEKTVKNVFEDSLSNVGVDKNVRDGMINRILGILGKLSGFITIGFGAFFGTILGCW